MHREWLPVAVRQTLTCASNSTRPDVNVTRRWSSRLRPPRCSRSSPVRRANLQPVFDAMLENATRLCGAKFGTLMLVEGDAVPSCRAAYAPSALVEHGRSRPLFQSASKIRRSDVPAATKQVAFDDDLRTTNLSGWRTACSRRSSILAALAP